MRGLWARIPLTGKVFLSYLGVVFAGAAPAFFYMYGQFAADLGRHQAQVLGERAWRASEYLRKKEKSTHAVLLRSLAPAYPERITFLHADGTVLFDSQTDPRRLKNHLQRPEVQRALGKLPALPHFEAELPGVGVAMRDSGSMGGHMLYAAAVVRDAGGEIQGVLRLALPAHGVQGLRERWLGVLRNSQAAAVSASLLLSLLAALMLVRPLRRLTDAASRLKKGQAVELPWVWQADEVASLGQAMLGMGKKLRRWRAAALASDDLLQQLLNAVALPIAIYRRNQGQMMANAGGVALLGEDSQEQLHWLLSTPEGVCALEESAKTGHPIPLPQGAWPIGRHTSLGEHDGARNHAIALRKHVHVARFFGPGGEDLDVVLATSDAAHEAWFGSELLCPKGNHARRLAWVLHQALSIADAITDDAYCPPEAELEVADVHQRVTAALTILFAALRTAMAAEPPDDIHKATDKATALLGSQKLAAVPWAELGIAVDGGAVRISMAWRIPAEAIQAARTLLRPLGGNVRWGGSKSSSKNKSKQASKAQNEGKKKDLRMGQEAKQTHVWVPLA